MMRISYLTDQALATLRGQIPQNIPCYASDDSGFFDDLLERIDGVRIDSKYSFPDFDLDIASDFETSDPLNVRTLYSAMRDLPPAVACDERLWSGLAHGMFWNYVQYRQGDKIANRDERDIGTAFFFTNGRKRSLFVNCLSRLWWTGYLTYDERNVNDPFELTDLITKHAFASTIVLFSSSNMTANPEICLGVLDSIKKREQLGETIKRKHFVGSLRYLNNMGGITVLDVLSRAEITKIVDNYLASDEFATMKLVPKKAAINYEDAVEDTLVNEALQSNTRTAYDPIIDDLEYYGFEYVDERNSGGMLWVVGNEGLEEFVEYWRDRLVVFHYAEKGGEAVQGRPCWWTNDKSPE